MRPIRCASSASIMRPVSVSSIVRARPMRGSISIGPVTLGMPALISGWPIRTPGCPTRASVSITAWNADRVVELAPRLEPVRPFMAGLEFLGLLEILAGAERALARAGQDHGLDGG